MNDGKFAELKPDWRSWFWHYLGAALLVPFLAGIFLLRVVHRKRTAERYEIHEKLIRKRTGEDRPEEEMDLAAIGEIRVLQSRTEKWFDTGSLLLYAQGRSLELKGIAGPHRLRRMILHAAEAEKERLRRQQKRKPRSPDPRSGSLDRLDYLTGLWQQGLITNEEYEKEKRHFEG